MRRDYGEDLIEEVLTTLATYGDEAWHREPERVRLAALKLAAGDLERLRQTVTDAGLDYRDVLAAAEYPAYLRTNPGDLGEEERVQIIEADWQQYQAWLLCRR